MAGMAVASDRLYVTFVDAFNGLLKIWGQPNRTCATYVEKQLSQLIPEFNRSPAPFLSRIHRGMVCVAKYEDENYYRARVLSEVSNNAVLVHFIDYGNKVQIQLHNIRIISNPNENVISTIVPQAEEYYLANIKSVGVWSEDVMNDIRRGLCYSEYKYRTVCQSGFDRLIQISYRNEDYSSFLIRQNLAIAISVKEQMILIRSQMYNQSIQPVGAPVEGPSYYQSMAPMEIPVRGPSCNQQVFQPSDIDRFLIPDMAHLGPITQGHLNLPGHPNLQSHLPQSTLTNSQNRSDVDGHCNVSTPTQNGPSNPSDQNPEHSKPKPPGDMNTVVIEAIACQIKNHVCKDKQLKPSNTASEASGYVCQVLDIKTSHKVYVSYIDDGPWSFSIQLVSNEQELNQLMEDLAAFNFEPKKLPLTLGTACIAKSMKYDSYCRGALVNVAHSTAKVFYVDFGNTEELPFNEIFEIPVHFFKVKTMSQKFALSGLQSITPTEEIKKAFTEVVENELLILHVTNLEGENLPTCDLYLKDVNIKRILNEKLRQVKAWDPIQFPSPGEIENALVTCVEGPHKFFVQLKRCEPELNELKMELARLGATAEQFDLEEISPGIKCICFYARETSWYRAVVTSVNSDKMVTVFCVDYGYSEVVDITMLRKICSGLIMKIKVQAIPCCLHGHEGLFRTSSSKSLLTDLILDRVFSLKVVSDEKDHINVQLFDNGKDVSLAFRSDTLSPQSSSASDTKDKSENHVEETDSVKKKSSVRTSPSFTPRPGPSGQSDRTDSAAGRGSRDSRNERSRGDLLSWRTDDRRTNDWRSEDRRTDDWRSDDSRKGFGPKAKDESKNIKGKDVKEPLSESKNGARIGRYCFRGKKDENGKVNDKDQKSSERNWRETENSGGKNLGGDGDGKTKFGESISERMKRAARENEERGLRLNDNLITKLPVKLENIAFHGHVFTKKEVELGSTEDVIVTYFVNPHEIYLQLVSCKENFRKFMVEIDNYYSTKLPMLNKPKKGDVVVAKFQQDGILYRALVLESEPIILQYVDFGNEEISERENLWPMDKRFLQLETQCLKCALQNLKPVGSDTWPAPKAEIDNIFEYESYSCTFLKKLDDGYEVNLINSETGANVRDELIAAGFADPADPVEDPADSVKEPADPVEDPADPVEDPADPVEDPADSVKGPADPIKGPADPVKDPADSVKKPADPVETVESPPPVLQNKSRSACNFDLISDEIFNVFVTHVVDAEKFYIQILSRELQDIQEQIHKFTTGEQFEWRTRFVGKIKNGDLVLVKIASGDWQRAKIIEKREIDVTVGLIDVGKVISIDRKQIGRIPDNLVKYPPQAIRCCLLIDKDEPTSELNEELSSCVNKNFVAFFHEVSDKGLKVTLYSSEGEKLKFLNSCNDAPAFVRPIADLPIVNRQMQVTTSIIYTPKDIYVQLLNDIKDLEKLRSSMMNFYNNTKVFEIEEHLSEYEMYAVKSISDHSWYRAQLLSQNNRSAKMFYIDFGNYEYVPKQNVRKLDASFYDCHAYAKKVSLNLHYDDYPEMDITVKLQNLIGGKECTGFFVKVNDVLYVEFDVDGSLVSPQLLSRSVQELTVGLFEEYIPKSMRERIRVFLSHVAHPGEFWVQEESISCELNAFQDKLQMACYGGIPKYDIEVGDILGILYRDSCWYRVLVTFRESNIMSLHFLDYGHSIIIDKTDHTFILLNEELRKPGPFARKCSLKGFWTKNATSRFEKIVLHSGGTFHIIKLSDENDKVDILRNGFSVTELMIKEGYEDKEDVVIITHINSPSDFYIQRDNEQNLLEMLMAKLIDSDLMEDVVNVNVNELYSAQNPEDELWYRARVLSKDENKIVVRFIDYGNCATVTKFKKLPEELKTAQPLSTNCCLVNEKSTDPWSEAAKNYFCKFFMKNPLKMEILKLESKVHVVCLSTDCGEDVTKILIGLGKDVDPAPEPEPSDNEIVNGENQGPLICQEETASTDPKDSCPSKGDANSEENSDANTYEHVSPKETPNFPECNTEEIVPGSVSPDDTSEHDENTGYARKLSHSERIVPGCITRGLSLEEVSARDNRGKGKKLTHGSLSAPVTPSMTRRPKQVNGKIEREHKPLPGPISNGSSLVGAQNNIDPDKKQVAANVNGTVKDVQN